MGFHRFAGCIWVICRLLDPAPANIRDDATQIAAQKGGFALSLQLEPKALRDLGQVPRISPPKCRTGGAD